MADGTTTQLQLSPAQEEAIAHRGSHLQIIACAGSGKTESLSRRIASLIADGTEPQAIVAFTFTEKAAAELKERITRRVEEAMGAEFLGRLGPMYVGTIHGYCFRLLQDHVPEYGNFDVLDPHRHAGLLSREYRRLRLDRFGDRHWAPIARFAQTVDIVSNELIREERLDGTPFGECYGEYLDTLERYHYLTFGLIIVKAIRALEHPTIYERVHGQLQFLFVDEYQDINPSQERLIELLGADPVQVCVVGDDDQSIYQWRGADVRNILTFAQRKDDVHQVELVTNRRSRPGIIEVANEFARTIEPRLEKEMEPARGAGECEVVPWSAETAIDEAERIADAIHALQRRGMRYRDIAVLYRSVRTSAPPLIEALRHRRIPVNCGGRTGLFLQPEISALARTHVWFVDGDWRPSPWEEATKVTYHQLATAYAELFPITADEVGRYLRDWKKLTKETNRPVNLVGNLYRFLRLLHVHEIDLDEADGASRVGAIARFSQVLADFENVTRRGRYHEEDGKLEFRGGTDRGIWYYRRLANFIQHYARDAYEDFEGETLADVDAVDILTVHQAKGLEWPIVFVPAMTSRRFPSGKAGKAQDWLLPIDVFPAESRRRYEGGDSEERRLFYVAMTRARDCLYASAFRRINKAQAPSPYLVELFGRELPDHDPLPLPASLQEAREQDAPVIQLSFSDLTQYDDCPHRFRLSNSIGYQTQLASELGYGRAVHHVLRNVADHARETGSVPTIEHALELLDREFYLPFAHHANFKQLYDAAQRLVTRYVEEYADDFTRIWATERPFEIHVPDGRVTGRADVILDRHEGRPDSLAILDYKTATGTEQDAQFAFQLAVYAAAGRGEGMSVDAAFLHELKDGRRREIDISEATTASAIDRVTVLVNGVRAGRFPAQPERLRCTSCDYKRVCGSGDCDPLDLM